ncbi:transglutaminase-like domain-containing protein [Pseudooceanicola sp. C21-150M6]|uniref:transglutaminase-like domain-containing protein n=1 Tax=Pseudooceanicola sp. C21-150M6 TaxID=3434355 RepID=UPI003D7F4C2E
MRYAIDVSMTYRFAEPPLVLLAVEAAEMPGQIIRNAALHLGEARIDRVAGDCGIGDRIWARPQGQEMGLAYHAEVEITRAAPPLAGLGADPLYALPAEAVPYLRPSRYCQSDKFTAYVEKHFSHLQGGAKVAAMRDWIEGELSYVPGASDADTHVLETFASRQGVCRDYAHLLCAMVRAARIPARAVAAYGPRVAPQDFHAVVEVWLDGEWHLVDGTGMGGPEDLTIIAVGRDAYDIAFMESDLPAELVRQEVRVTLL